MTLLACASVATQAARERNATISGTIKRDDGKPAQAALVMVDGFLIQTFAGKDGKYTLKGVPWGIQTIVAIQRGYKPGKRLNLDVKRGARISGIDFTLEKDPSYVPDAIKFDDMSPPPDAIVPPNKQFDVKGVIRYRLKNDRTARVVLMFQDDKGNDLVLDRPRYDIKEGSSNFSFRRTLRTPMRFGNAEIYVMAALVPGDRDEVVATDIVTYQVRTFNDDIKFGAIGMSPDDSRANIVNVTASLDYVLETVDSGAVHLRILGDEGKGDFSKTLIESSQPVNRAKSSSGTLDFSASFIASTRLKSIRFRADLISTGATEPKLVKWSKSYPPPDPGSNTDRK